MSYSGSSKKIRRIIADKARAQINESKDSAFLAELNFADWDAAFDHLNDRYWSGSLSKIPVSTESTRKARLGWFGHAGYIKLSNNKGLSPKEMLGVLLHEMCHHAVHEKYGHGQANGRGGRVIGHGKEWKSEMRRVGYLGKITRFSGRERFI
ncbi:MAG: hypothetical protein CBC29_06160 [Methylococcaceae bacterium TMED69]|nr:MAG: hypothetical protein CBC29_06160 [Methylococcaceae bacterium TMED69]|tara:strand:+ start:2526 stop:2981 length:456 start_codon:yes stop_codon:yes gene_type:complete